MRFGVLPDEIVVFFFQEENGIGMGTGVKACGLRSAEIARSGGREQKTEKEKPG